MIPASGSRAAFTLIELLVVIAVLGVLAALLAPALAASRCRARSAACASNLRQIGVALQLYSDDHDGDFPFTTHGRPHADSWVYTLAGYLANVDRVRISPGDPRGAERLAAHGTSYVMNEYLTVPLETFGGVTEDYTNRRRLARPTDTFATFIGADHLAPSITADHTHSRAWASGWETVLADIQPDRHRAGPAAPDHTRGAANYLYADGRVMALAAARLAELHRATPDLARPPE